MGRILRCGNRTLGAGGIPFMTVAAIQRGASIGAGGAEITAAAC